MAFVGPEVIGGAFGSELRFVLFLVSTVSALIGWSPVRPAQANRIDDSEQGQ